jgi:hypothetical protein
MSPSVIDLVGSRYPQKGTQFVVSETGVKALKKMHERSFLKQGDILVYPEYENVNARTMGSLWMNMIKTEGGMQVPVDKDLFEKAIFPQENNNKFLKGKER